MANKTIGYIILAIILVMVTIVAFFSFTSRRAHAEQQMISVLILVCSSLSAPDPQECMIDNSVRHEVVGKVDDVAGCEMTGMMYAAEHLKPSEDQYIKVLCGLPSQPDKPKERNT